MVQIEANACGKPVIGIKAMGMLDTMVHKETAYLANIAQEVRIKEAIIGSDHGFDDGRRITFKRPRTVDYRASVYDIADYLMKLMTDAKRRDKMGEDGRRRIVERFDYRIVAKRFVELITTKLGIT